MRLRWRIAPVIFYSYNSYHSYYSYYSYNSYNSYLLAQFVDNQA